MVELSGCGQTARILRYLSSPMGVCSGWWNYPQEELEELGRHCSASERNSEAAERNLREYFVMELLAKHLGDDFAGTVAGVTSQGIFVQIDRYLIDGFVRIDDLPSSGGGGERWRVNTATGALVAQRSGKTITIGDALTVRLAKVDPHARRMELAIIDTQPPGKKKRRQPVVARKAHPKTTKLKKLGKQKQKQKTKPKPKQKQKRKRH